MISLSRKLVVKLEKFFVSPQSITIRFWLEVKTWLKNTNSPSLLIRHFIHFKFFIKIPKTILRAKLPKPMVRNPNLGWIPSDNSLEIPWNLQSQKFRFGVNNLEVTLIRNVLPSSRFVVFCYEKYFSNFI